MENRLFGDLKSKDLNEICKILNNLNFSSPASFVARVLEGFPVGNIIEFIKGLFGKPMSLNELKSLFSGDLDSLIIKSQNEGLKYGGGMFVVEASDQENLKLSFEMYFQNREKKFVKKSAESGPIPITCLKETARNELLAKQKIQYDIEFP